MKIDRNARKGITAILFAAILVVSAFVGISPVASAAVDRPFNYMITATGTEDIITYPDQSFTWTVTGTGTETWYEVISGDYIYTTQDGYLAKYRTSDGEKVWDMEVTISVYGMGLYPTNIEVPDRIIKHTSTVTAIDTGSGTVNKLEGDKDMGTFSAYPQPQHGGTISGVTYSITDDNPNVETWISGNHAYTSTDYSETATTPWSATETGSASVNKSEDGKYITTSTLEAPNHDTTWSVTDDSEYVGTWMMGPDLYARAINQRPIANANGPYANDEGSSMTFDASGSFDPDGDLLTYRWDFNNDGVWDTEWSSSPTASYTWADDWSGTAKVEVSDDKLTDTGTVSVTVNNVAPTVEAGPDQIADEGDTVSFSGSFTDPGWLDTHTIEWDFGDGGTATGTLTPTHVYGDNGTYTVTLTVTDDDGGVGSDTLTVTVRPVPKECTCNSCDDCEAKLNDPSCTVVKLTADIRNYGGTCINNPANFNNKIFDCQGHTIDGDDPGGDYGIYLSKGNHNTIKNCVITDFLKGIYISSSKNTLVDNIVSSNDYGMYFSSRHGSGGNPAIWTMANINLNGFTNLDLNHPIDIDGKIIAWEVYSAGGNGTNNIKLKVFRDNGTHYLFIGEDVETITSAGLHKFSADIDVRVGDLIALRTPISSVSNYCTVHSSGGGNTSQSLTQTDIVTDTLKGDWKSRDCILSFNVTVEGVSKNNVLINNTVNSNTIYGIYFDLDSKNNTLNSNIFCNNLKYDIYNADSNSGDENTCDTTYNYNDTGTTGCTYSCVDCNCSTCDECEAKLNDPACSIVTLTADIINHSGTCINMGVNNVTLDCVGHLISGTGSGKGINITNFDNATIKNCNIKNFFDAIYIESSLNNNLRDINVSSTGRGIAIWSSSNNNLTDINASSNAFHGVSLYSSLNNTLTDITTNSNNRGIYIYSSSNNILTSITANSNTYNGIWLDYYSSNNQINNTIINDSGQGGAIYLTRASDNNNFTNVTVTNTTATGYDIALTGIDGTYLIDTHLSSYYFTDAGGTVYFKDTGEGEIKFLETVNGTGSNLNANSSGVVWIANNSISVNSTLANEFNVSANITIYNTDALGFIDRVPYRDGVVCPASICTELIDADTYVFKVTYFTNYSVGEGALEIAVDITTDKDKYCIGEPVNVVITATNEGSDVTLAFPNSQLADFEVTNSTGGTIYTWSHGRYFADIITEISIKHGQTVELLNDTWNQTDNYGNPVPPGTYYIDGWMVESYSYPEIHGEIKQIEIVRPEGGMGIAVLPRLSTVTAGSTVDLNVKIVSNENFDDIFHIYLTLDGLPPIYQANLSWFNWTDTTVSIPAGGEAVIPLRADIPTGVSGYKAFRAMAESTKWTPKAMDTGIFSIL